MANPVEDQLKLFEALRSSVFGLSDSIQDVSEEYANLSGQIKKNVQEMVKGNQSVTKTVQEYARLRKEQKERLKDIALTNKALKQQREVEEQVRKQIEKMSMTTREKFRTMGSAFEDAVNGVKRFSNSVMGLATTLGATGISLNSIVSSGMKYERSLFNISRTQNAVGRGSKDFASALAFVRKNTNLAQAEFVEFAETVTDSFLGIKPSMMEIANLSKLLAGAVGPTFEAQKKAAQELMTVQSRFPALYREINELMEMAQDPKANRDELNSRRAILQVRMQESGLAKQADEMLKVTKAKAEEEKNITKALTEQQKMSKALSDTQIKMYQELRPLMLFAMKTISAIATLTSDYSKTIATVTVGVTGLKTLFALANARPYVRIATAILAAGTAMVAFVEKQNKSKKIEQDKIKMVALEAQFAKDVANLKGKELEARQKEFEEIKKSGASVEDMALQLAKITQEHKDQQEAAIAYRKSYEGIVEDVTREVELLNKVTEALKTQVSVSEEFGMVNEKAYGRITQMAEATKKQLDSSAEAAIKGVVSQYSGTRIPMAIDVKSDKTTQLEQLHAALLEEEKLADTEAKRAKAHANLVAISNELTKQKQQESIIVKSIFSDSEKYIRLQEQSTSAYEARLDTEKRLMESAQFGMGASIEMMQKQVDLAYKLGQTYADADKDLQKQLTTKTKIKQQDINAIQNAKTQAEAQDYIKRKYEEGSKEAMGLALYAQKHQEWTKKTMEQQQKIYDLTKDIREGYLDAMQEMSSGAGEFEKIIGTQEMGVTQLMDAVKDVTGAAKLNTMALGGLQEQTLTAKGVGTEVTGRYQAGGKPISFIGGETQEARNQRIYQYDVSKARARAQTQGMGGPSQVGEANVTGAENLVGPEQEANIIGDAVYDGVRDAMKESMGGRDMATATYQGYKKAYKDPEVKRELTRAVNQGVKESKFNQGETSKFGNAANAAVGALMESTAPAIASPINAPGGFTGAPGSMNIPGRVTNPANVAQAMKEKIKRQEDKIAALTTASATSTPSAISGAAPKDMLDIAYDAEKKGGKYAAGVGLLGMVGLGAKTKIGKDLALDYAKMELGAARAGDAARSQLGRGAGGVLRDTVYKSTEKAALARSFQENSKQLAKKQAMGKYANRVASLKGMGGGIAGGLGASSLGGDIARDLGLSKGAQEGIGTGAGVLGGIVGTLAPTAGLALAAGAAGYKAGTYIDKTFGISDKLGGMMSNAGWFGGGPISAEDHERNKKGDLARAQNRARWEAEKKAEEKAQREWEERKKAELEAQQRKEAEEKQNAIRMQAQKKAEEARAKIEQDKQDRDRKVLDLAEGRGPGEFKGQFWHKGIKYATQEKAYSAYQKSFSEQEASKNRPAGRLSKEQEELISRTAGFREEMTGAFGAIKPAKGETQEQAEAKMATKYFMSQHVDKFSKEEADKALQVRQGLKAGLGKGKKKGAASYASGVVEGATTEASTSAAAERGETGVALSGQEQSYMSGLYDGGEEGGGGGGAGGGKVVVIVKLSPELSGDLEHMGAVIAELEQGSA